MTWKVLRVDGRPGLRPRNTKLLPLALCPTFYLLGPKARVLTLRLRPVPASLNGENLAVCVGQLPCSGRFP